MADSIVKGLLPSALGEGTQDPVSRRNKYGESITRPWDMNVAVEEGTRHVAVNPTPGTLIATTTSITAFTVASPIMIVQNSYSGANAPNIILDYLRLILGQVPTSATRWDWLQQLDPSVRYSSAGSQITPRPLNTGVGNSGALIYFGALVAAAAGANARYVHRSMGRSVIPVTTDEWLFKFGSGNYEAPSTLGGAVALRIPIPSGPVVLKPGDSWLLYGWGASNAAAPTFEFELGYTER